MGSWVDGWFSGSMGGVRSYYQISNKSWSNWDNSILFEDLWFIETSPPMGGCMGEWMGQWVGSGQMTNLIKLELIDIIRFCLKIYDLWRHPHIWVDVWVNGWAHVKSLKLNKSWPNWDNSIVDIFDIFWTFYLNHLSPLWGYISDSVQCNYWTK